MIIKINKDMDKFMNIKKVYTYPSSYSQLMPHKVSDSDEKLKRRVPIYLYILETFSGYFLK